MSNITVTGLGKFRANLANFDSIARTALQETIRIMTMFLLRDLKTGGYVPLRTGLLKQSIRPRIFELKSVIEPNVNYAIFVHEGTRFMRARPFFKWAIDKNINQLENILESGANKVADKLTK